MQFSLFKRFYAAECNAVAMRLYHDLFAYRPVKSEHLHEGLYHMLHRIHVVIMEKDLIQCDVCRMMCGYCSGFGRR